MLAAAVEVALLTTVAGAVGAAEAIDNGEIPAMSMLAMNADSPIEVLELVAVAPCGCVCVCIAVYVCSGGCDCGAPCMGPAPNCAEPPAIPVCTAAEGTAVVVVDGAVFCCANAIICDISTNEWPRLIIDVAQASISECIARWGVADVPIAAIACTFGIVCI